MLKFKTINIVFIIAIITLLALCTAYNISLYSFLFLFLLWLTFTVIGSFNILWNYHIDVYHANPKIQGKKIAITFDDGPHPVITPRILDLLKEYEVMATFFCIGKEVKAYPNIAKRIIDEGHVIGNHSYSHSNMFGFFSSNKVLSDIKKCNDLIFNEVGKNVKLFRPPFGVTNPSIAKAMKKTKYHAIGWNVRSLDTVLKNKQLIFNRITKDLKSGDVILMHDTSERTLHVLEQLLLFLYENKFEAVTVDTLFNIDAYA